MIMNRNIKVESYYAINTIERLSNPGIFHIDPGHLYFIQENKFGQKNFGHLSLNFYLRTSRNAPYTNSHF